MIFNYLKHTVNKYISYLLSIILIINSSGLLADELDTLTVALFTMPREIVYWDEKGGNAQGPLVKLYRSIGVELGLEMQFVGPLPFKRVMAGLSNGTYQSSAFLSKNPVREQSI